VQYPVFLSFLLFRSMSAVHVNEAKLEYVLELLCLRVNIVSCLLGIFTSTFGREVRGPQGLCFDNAALHSSNLLCDLSARVVCARQHIREARIKACAPWRHTRAWSLGRVQVADPLPVVLSPRPSSRTWLASVSVLRVIDASTLPLLLEVECSVCFRGCSGCSFFCSTYFCLLLAFLLALGDRLLCLRRRRALQTLARSLPVLVFRLAFPILLVFHDRSWLFAPILEVDHSLEALSLQSRMFNDTARFSCETVLAPF
jgi:hypothetical protein